MKVLQRYFWFRHFVGNAAYFLNILAMSNLPLGITMILFNIAPFWSILFGKLINSSTINCTQVLLMLGSFIGVILVACSKMIVQDLETEELNEEITNEANIPEN